MCGRNIMLTTFEDQIGLQHKKSHPYGKPSIFAEKLCIQIRVSSIFELEVRHEFRAFITSENLIK